MKKMKQVPFLIMLLFAFANNSYGQKSESNFTDDYFTSNFEILYSVDTEMAYCIAPIVEERLVSDLADTTSFYNPFKKLSEYISIETSSDSLVKTYSWDRISGGSWHDNASYIQFKTKSGKIKYKRLDSGIERETGEPTDVIIYDIMYPFTLTIRLRIVRSSGDVFGAKPLQKLLKLLAHKLPSIIRHQCSDYRHATSIPGLPDSLSCGLCRFVVNNCSCTESGTVIN